MEHILEDSSTIRHIISLHMDARPKEKSAWRIKPCLKISFFAQEFLLTALYEEWDDFTVTAAAEQIKVS